MKKRGKRTAGRKATQRIAERRKPGGIDSEPARAVKAGISAEMRSLEINAEKLSRYAGQWLLLVQGKLIAHSGSYSVIAGEISRKGVRDGLVYYVPKPEESDFVLV